MNKMLEKAIAAIARLPEADQEAIAFGILEEIESDKGWDARFANSQQKLADLSKRAGDHISAGTTLPFDPSDRSRR